MPAGNKTVSEIMGEFPEYFSTPEIRLDYPEEKKFEFVEKAKERGYGADDFGSDSYPIDEWGEMVEKQVIDIGRRNGIATVLMHPICLYLADEFRTAEKLLKIFSQYKTIWAKEMPLYIKQKSNNPEGADFHGQGRG